MKKLWFWIVEKRNQRTLMFLIGFVGGILGLYFKYLKEPSRNMHDPDSAGTDAVMLKPGEVDKGNSIDMGSTGSRQNSISSGGGVSVNADRGASVNITK